MKLKWDCLLVQSRPHCHLLESPFSLKVALLERMFQLELGQIPYENIPPSPDSHGDTFIVNL